jgi:hypothetical protein
MMRLFTERLEKVSPEKRGLLNTRSIALKAFLIVIVFATAPFGWAQEKVSDFPITDVENLAYTEAKIAALEKKKTAVIETEKEALKITVLEIDKRLKRGEINAASAAELKKEAASLRAQNIEARTAIIDLEIALLKRNNGQIAKIKTSTSDLEEGVGFSVNVNGRPLILLEDKDLQYDIRTYSDLVISMGINNLVNFDREISGLEDVDFQLGGSRFLEIGWEWRTRLVQSNFVRLNYGVSFQFNGLRPKNNQYVAVEQGVTSLQTFEYELRKSKFRTDNLVFPLHLEFGASDRMVTRNKMRYSIYNSFRIGIGGYAGVNLGNRQKLKYTLNGERIKEKFKQGYDVTDIIYGISAYAGRGGTQIYAKYDLNPMFGGGTIAGNNLSLGLRFDL